MFRTDFSYDAENKPTLMTYGDDTNKVAYSYDNLGRTAAKTLTVDGRAYETGYTYLPGSNGSGNTTALISVLSQPGEAFSYTYDDVGNISSVTRNGVTTTYVYDKLGQLIRVNDPEDTADGTTWVYEYDLGGNILCKKRYAYTTGELGSVLETIAYEYDTVWKDKLVKYDGNAITYDAIGNPLTDGTWTYTWEKGRQLKQMTKSGTTATFLYNADGLRIRKTVGSTVTNYTLHGKNIVHMTQGSNTLHFWYAAQNRPAIVQFNGTKYGYIHNLQGDVIGLIDSAGTEVVKYVYDAWGKILSTTGSPASTLGSIQPFRYRGYVYDQETGLYYLENRYYCPVFCRFLNCDIILARNLFPYCLNNPINNVDHSGMLITALYWYFFEKVGGLASEYIEYYAPAEVLPNIDEIRVRVYPSCSVRYETIAVEDIDYIYVDKQTQVEDDYRGITSPENHDENRIWFSVMIFTGDRLRDPIEGFVASDVLYVIAPFNSKWLGSLENEGYVNVRKAPGRHSERLYKVEHGTPVTVLRTDQETGWLYVNTPVGNGWVDPNYVHPPLG